jgi:signal transduction histidine kinase
MQDLEPPAGDAAPPGVLARARSWGPKTFQGKLTLAFVAVVAATLFLVTMLVLNRLGAYFDQQQQEDLTARARGVAQYVVLIADAEAGLRPVVSASDVVDQSVVLALRRSSQQRILADRLAQADVTIRLGLIGQDGGFQPASNGTFEAMQEAQPAVGQSLEPVTSDPLVVELTARLVPYAVEVTLANPYTYRATAIGNVTGLLAFVGLVALAVAIVVAAWIAGRITTPLRRLTEASRDLAEGDLARRVPADSFTEEATELAELATQFDAMAERLQESIDIIRSDRDRSREFLADVSHELRTPIAAMRTFNELLVEGAVENPATRREFLESSAAQLERLDWLALNLLELSKLDSGLVLLDLRPEDVRATVEQAVEQAAAAARRRGIDLTLTLPPDPVRLRHDPVRVGQVVSNLVGNALKFTPKGGRVTVEVSPVSAAADGPATSGGRGVLIRVADTGVGIDAAELPRIFDRFYRGSRASEARGSGSGLGLAIVRSIVDMHGGTVGVESAVGRGSVFTVRLPAAPPPRGEPGRNGAADGEDRFASGGRAGR